MTLRIRIAPLIAIALLGSAGADERQIPRISGQIQIDGVLDDWHGAPSLTNADFVSHEVGEGAGLDPDDLAVRVFLAWQESRLLVAIERLDDVLVLPTVEETQTVWQFDGAEIRVDGDRSRGRYRHTVSGFCGLTYEDAIADGVIDAAEWVCVKDRHANDRHAQGYTLASTASGAVRQQQIGFGKDWVLERPWTEMAASTSATEDGTQRLVIEAAVTPFDSLDARGPAFSLPSVLEPGAVIGLDVVVPDFDGQPGGYRGFHSLSSELDSWNNADSFVPFRLVDDRATSVESAAWADVKALAD